jgi:hypothetical protein
MARMLLYAADPPSSAPEAAGAVAASTLHTALNARRSQQQAAWQHWVAALPEHVPLAFAHASEAELRGIRDEGLVSEALGVQQLMLDSFEVRRLCVIAAWSHIQRPQEHGVMCSTAGEHHGSTVAMLTAAGLLLRQGSSDDHSLEAWRWAWSCAHSRSFKDGAGGHLIVPGVDMANHAFAPSASVRSAPLYAVYCDT